VPGASEREQRTKAKSKTAASSKNVDVGGVSVEIACLMSFGYRQKHAYKETRRTKSD
jgi:hypothetical protein